MYLRSITEKVRRKNWNRKAIMEVAEVEVALYGKEGVPNLRPVEAENSKKEGVAFKLTSFNLHLNHKIQSKEQRWMSLRRNFSQKQRVA